MGLSKESRASKLLDILEKVFLGLFSFYVMLGSNNLTYGTKIISLAMWLSFLMGAVVVLYRAINYKKYIKMPGFWALFALLFSIGLSTLVNCKYSLKENIVLCIYWALFFFVFYVTDQEMSVEKAKRNAEIISLIFVLYTLICVIISFYMMFAGISGKIIAPDTGYEYYRGFSIGRLWGIFINPNNGAISAAVASIIILYFMMIKKKWWISLAGTISIFLELMFIALSDSRSGAVCFGMAIAVFFAVTLLYKFKNKGLWLKLLTVFMALVVAVVGFVIPRQLKKAYNAVSVAILEQRETPENTETSENTEAPENTETPIIDNDLNKTEQDLESGEEETIMPSVSEDKAETTINIAVVDRGYDLSDDISNRRFDVWKGAVQLFAESPKSVLVGYSFKGFTEQAITLQPENYLVNNDYTIFTTLDNEFFNVLVSQGITGIISLLIFVAAVFLLIFKKIKKVDDKNQFFAALCLAVLSGLALSAMFCSVMFYHLSLNAILFWCLLGYFVHVLKKSTGEKTDG